MLTDVGLGAEPMTRAAWASLELWLGQTLPVFRMLLSKKRRVMASPTKDRLWEKGSKIWVKAHYSEKGQPLAPFFVWRQLVQKDNTK